MKNSNVKRFLYGILTISLFYGMYSCTKVDVAQDDYISLLTDNNIGGLEVRSNHGCYELVFPISILLSDGNIVIIESQDSLKKILNGFCMSNESKPRPEIVFPITIKAQDGTLIKIGSKAEIKALKEECFKNSLDSMRHKDDRHSDSLCFTLLFPLKVKKSTGDTVTVNSKDELNAVIRDSSHGKSHKNRTELIFPLDVKLSDGSTLTLKNEDELKALIRKC